MFLVVRTSLSFYFFEFLFDSFIILKQGVIVNIFLLIFYIFYHKHFNSLFF